MFKTLTSYNYRNNTPLLNDNTREAICKVMEEDSIVGTNNFTADTFSRNSNPQIENANATFTSQKLDKSDKLEDSLNDLTINDTEYYELNSETLIGAQGDLTRNTETVTHTSNSNETVMDTSNGNFVQKYCVTGPSLSLS